MAPVIGSPSENAHRNGTFDVVNVRHAARLASDASSSGLVGTKVGNALGPALYISLGNGAS